MFGIGGFELFLILLFGFLIFGPDKLPEIAKTVGKAIAKFRGAQETMTEQLKDATLIDKDSDSPLKNPLDVLSDMTKKPGASSKKTSASKEESSEVKNETPPSDADVKRSDSFAERKARYDRERAARKKAEAEAAKAEEEKASKDAAEKAAIADNPKIDVAAKSVTEEGE